ncbi:hypothetical protein FA13DRAFT_1793286 [Coprinellus micaceus]|uniref:F-box domain-containing protein n=1 Tax=Coprinellus micaceus TaxID=71717 RepID=A0A4Y7T5F7_COPMI|nr:hypothetical protein FA13DRAFT_1793286 [Coprinellus micaceus]
MNTPFADLLDTNYTPSDDDIPRIRAIVDANTRAASSIDKEITRLLSSLVQRRDAHLESANRHASLLSPVRRIPDDILSAIFHAYLDTKAPAPMSRSHPAVVVSHVSQRWRQLAISTPYLWNGIHLHLPQYPSWQPSGFSSPRISVERAEEAADRWGATVQHMLAIAEVWVARSGQYPVDVTLGALLETQPQDDIAFPPKIKMCLTSLCDFAHRWKRARIDLSFGRQQSNIADILEPLTSLQPHHVPQLESLHLNVFHIGDDTTLRPTVITTPILQGAAIRTLHLYRVWQDWRILPVIWSALTELRFATIDTLSAFASLGFGGLGSPLAQFTPLQAFTLLKQCPNLVTCDLTISPDNWRPLDRLASMTGVAFLPKLQSLTIRGRIPNTEFVQALSLPSLHSLQLTRPISGILSEPGPAAFTFGAPAPPSNNTGEALAWVRQFGHQLHTVKLNVTRISCDVLQSLLEHLSSASDLSLKFLGHRQPQSGRGSFENNGLTRLLAVPSRSNDLRTGANHEPAPICPRLCRLRLDMNGQPGSITEEGVIDMIASRRGPKETRAIGDSARLEDVTIHFGTLQTMDVRQELERRGVDMAKLDFEASYPSPEPLKPHRPYTPTNDLL